MPHTMMEYGATRAGGNKRRRYAHLPVAVGPLETAP